MDIVWAINDAVKSLGLKPYGNNVRDLLDGLDALSKDLRATGPEHEEGTARLRDLYAQTADVIRLRYNKLGSVTTSQYIGPALKSIGLEIPYDKIAPAAEGS